MLIRPRRIPRGMAAWAAPWVAAPWAAALRRASSWIAREPRRRVLRASLLLLALAGPGALSVSAPAAELRVVLEAAPVTLNPLLAADAAGVRISHQLLCETLLTLGENLKIEPGLAERWERLSPKLYRFHLRPGVRFASGAPLDARDAVATLQRVLDPATGSPYGAALREKVDALRIVPERGRAPLAFDVALLQPYASILSDLVLPVLRRDAEAGRTPDAGGPAGAARPFDCSGPTASPAAARARSCSSARTPTTGRARFWTGS